MPSRLKVVHVVVAGQIGGAERFLADLATRPEGSDADHVIALLTPNPGLRAFFARTGVKIADRGPTRENPLATLWRSLGPADIAWLEGVVRDENPDVLHAHTYASHVLAARASQRTARPLVRTEHGIRHYRDPTCALLRRFSLEATSRICAVSGFVAGFIAARFPSVAKRVEVIHNGLDLSLWPPAEPFTTSPFTFLVLSRLDPIKRVGLIIEAAARVPGIGLVIAGEGPERARLERQADPARVRFLGRLENPRPALAACHAVVNGTREEGLGLSVIEAGAMARPAIAFAGGGIPEIVQDRHSGWLVHADSVQSLASAMAEAAADPVQAAAYGKNARALVEARFAIETMCSRYGAVYRAVVQQHTPGAAR